jgi:23S rRNA (adenine2503-C2)-methyltransferase
MLPDEVKSLMESLGQKGYRSSQIVEAIYRQRVTEIDEITVLPIGLREELVQAGYGVGLPQIVQAARSVDGTERYLMRLRDGETVETVWMPDGDGGERGDGSEASAEEEAVDGLEGNTSEFGEGPRRDSGNRDLRNRNMGALEQNGYRRATICISSQVGCAVNCQFCLTAKLGIKRNLTGGEIAGQVVAVLNRHGIKIGKDRINLVFMGMGEPFLNYDEFIRSVQLLVKQIGIPESRMTVSTSGIEPAIRKFAQEPLRPKLALSLNASNDTVREQVMPITRKWNIAQLLDAVSTIPLGKREWVTFEYVLLGGINDQPEHAREVLDLLEGMRAKVNLIVWNPGPGIAYTQPKPEDVTTFQKMLIDAGMPAYIRRPRGRDIYAACGQLKRTVDLPAADPLVEIAPAATPFA